MSVLFVVILLCIVKCNPSGITQIFAFSCDEFLLGRLLSVSAGCSTSEEGFPLCGLTQNLICIDEFKLCPKRTFQTLLCVLSCCCVFVHPHLCFCSKQP